MSATEHASHVAVLGTNRTAAVVAAGLAWLGNEVRCCRPDVTDLSAEPGLPEVLLRSVHTGRLRFTSDPIDDLVFLCGPKENDVAHLARKLPSGCVVVNSCLPPWESTTFLAEQLDRTDIVVASNPQSLREGAALDDFLEPGCVLIGTDDPTALRRIEALYAAVAAPVLHTRVPSADLAVPVTHGFFAIKQRFFDELARLCYAVGADARRVAECLCFDQRIGNARTESIQHRSVARLLELSSPDRPATLRALAQP